MTFIKDLAFIIKPKWKTTSLSKRQSAIFKPYGVKNSPCWAAWICAFGQVTYLPVSISQLIKCSQ